MSAATNAAVSPAAAGSPAMARRHMLTGLAALALCGRARRAVAAQAPTPLAERLARYAAALRYDDLDAKTIERVKAHVIDTIGCGIAAFDEPPVRICRDVALAGSGGTATVIGTSRRTSPDLATFANGAAFRYYDLNDVYVGTLSGHPSDHISACLAVAETERASAADLIAAIVLAYEVNCRLIDAFDITARGWDAPVFSLPAVALAAGKLMRLSPEKLTQAVNLAINGHIPLGQTRVQTLSDWKGLADAEAGRDAVFAAQLARGGLTGPAPIFEGRLGLFKQVTGPAEIDVGTFGGRGSEFRINRCGMKAYPAVVYGQTAIAASIEVAREVIEKAGSLARIAAIDIATTRRGLQQTASDPEKWAPETRDTADHSLPYLTARAMFDGDVTNESYAPAKLREPRVLAFMRNIKVAEDPVLTARVGAAVPTRVTAILADGQRVIRELDDVPGFVNRPMGRPDIDRKFHGNIATRWPKARADAALAALWDLEHTADVGALVGSLAG
jgi:2-methylcitrate dehydratase